MTWYNITQNRMTAGRAIISALALPAVFCGMAAGGGAMAASTRSMR